MTLASALLSLTLMAASDTPNVVLISIDTLRPDHLSCYGYERNTSPNLDALAAESARFENVYAHVSWTLVSHASIFTSMYPSAHDVGQTRAISSQTPTLTETLKEAGYATYGLYGSDWLEPKYGFQRGFDGYLYHRNREDFRNGLLGRLRVIAEDDEQPFFLFAHTHQVHASPLKRKKPIYDGPDEFREEFVPHPEVPIHDCKAEEVYFDRVPVSEEQLANILARYDGGILHVDAIVRDVLAFLREADLYDNTLVVITSDHGEALGDQGTLQGHGGFFEHGLRVPLIIKLPEGHPMRDEWRGAVVDRRVQSIDIGPTILEVAGITPPHTHQGHTLLRPKADSQLVNAGDVLAYTGGNAALIRGKYKLHLGGRNKTLLLFDLEKDPGETNSIHESHPELVKSMSMVLQARLREHRVIRKFIRQSETGTVELDPETKARLEALGYAVDK